MNVLLEGDADITRAIETALVKYYHDDDELRDRVMNHINNPSGAVRPSCKGEHFLYVICLVLTGQLAAPKQAARKTHALTASKNYLV